MLAGGVAAPAAKADGGTSVVDPVSQALDGTNTSYRSKIWQLLDTGNYTIAGGDGASIADYMAGADTDTAAWWSTELAIAEGEVGTDGLVTALAASPGIDLLALAAGGAYLIYHEVTSTGGNRYIKMSLVNGIGDLLHVPDLTSGTLGTGFIGMVGLSSGSSTSALVQDYNVCTDETAGLTWSSGEQFLSPRFEMEDGCARLGGLVDYAPLGSQFPNYDQPPCDDNSCLEFPSSLSSPLVSPHLHDDAIDVETAMWDTANAVAEDFGTEPTTASCNGSDVECGVVYLPDRTWAGAFLQVDQVTDTDPGGETQTITSTDPSSAGSLPAHGLGDGAAALEDPCLRAMLDHYLDASYPLVDCTAGVPDEIAVPAPPANMTCDDYVTALATLGYTGDASCVTLPEASTDPRVGPNAPSRITWTPPGSGPVTIGSAQWQQPSWGGNLPEISTGQTLTIYQNPSDAPPAPGGEGGNGAAPGCSGVEIPTLDLAPLEGIDFGDKFPFGVVNWMVNGISGWDNGGSDAPTITLPYFFNDFGHGSPGDYNQDVSLSRFDPFMTTFRALVVIEATIGAIWAYGSAALGWGRAGEQLTIPGM